MGFTSNLIFVASQVGEGMYVSTVLYFWSAGLVGAERASVGWSWQIIFQMKLGFYMSAHEKYLG